MIALSVALAVAVAQAPCSGERVALLPFQPVALTTAEAREVEDVVRRVAQATAGVCLEPRAETVAKVRARGGRLPVCGDAACRGAQVVALGADRVVRGVALGVGGGRSVALTLVDRGGLEAFAIAQLSGEELPPGVEEARARQSFKALWAERLPPAAVKRARTAWPTVLLAAGGVALAAGVGFGLSARRAEAALSAGTGDCAGEGQVFRACFAARVQDGRNQAGAANVLLGAGALLGAGGAVLFVWELP